jgi:hypothetical protein
MPKVDLGWSHVGRGCWNRRKIGAVGAAVSGRVVNAIAWIRGTPISAVSNISQTTLALHGELVSKSGLKIEIESKCWHGGAGNSRLQSKKPRRRTRDKGTQVATEGTAAFCRPTGGWNRYISESRGEDIASIDCAGCCRVGAVADAAWGSSTAFQRSMRDQG